MSQIDVLPELKEIVGAMLFAAKKPLTAKEMRKALVDTGEKFGGACAEFAALKEKDVKAAVEQLQNELMHNATGLCIAEVAHGYRLQNEINCGPWVRTLLDKDRTTKLSKPALETLAVIAYRQPVLRSEIEAVRGVAVDQILRNLVEMQLVKVVARSELPGRPWLFGTTQRFLEHFGLKSLEDLPGMDELRREKDEDKPGQTESFPAIEKELSERQNDESPEPEEKPNDEE